MANCNHLTTPSYNTPVINVTEVLAVDSTHTHTHTHKHMHATDINRILKTGRKTNQHKARDHIHSNQKVIA